MAKKSAQDKSAAAAATVPKTEKSKAVKKEATPPDESSEEESKAESSDEEEGKAAQVKAATKTTKAEDPAAGKRKADEESAPAAKKTKAEAPASAATTGSDNPPSQTLWIGNLSWKLDNAGLEAYFKPHGNVVSVRLQTDRETGRSRGIGYVEFTDQESAQKVYDLAKKEAFVIDGRDVKVDFATQRGANPDSRAKAFGDKISDPSATLWVGNLAFSMGEDDLWEAFGEHGAVTNIRMPTDRDTGAAKGFAYVQFGSEKDATAALQAINGKDLQGRRCRIDYAPARDENGGGSRGGFGGGRGGGRGRGGRGGGRGGRGRF
ncbi:Nuclear localization sequence binding protein [Phaffia rhodozyma]|uniref:Nuclear localization sequence binding protein n=1 Tax=Phaffia rhodozyma TaxID=264483 RepID=A0A0F7SMB4_PHARH|nr:Nuclear localization sequence binding protein [Phaffia rhodozyma]